LAKNKFSFQTARPHQVFQTHSQTYNVSAYIILMQMKILEVTNIFRFFIKFWS